jgi:hypothetical protein
MMEHSVHMTKRKGRDWLADSGESNSRRTQANATLDAAILDGTDKLRNPRHFRAVPIESKAIKLREQFRWLSTGKRGRKSWTGRKQQKK